MHRRLGNSTLSQLAFSGEGTTLAEISTRKMDVTRVRISRILELREILLSFQTGFSLVNAAVVFAILESLGLVTLISYN